MIRNWVPRHALQLLDGVPFKGGVHSSNSNQLILWPNQFPFQAKAVSAAKKADAVRELGGQRGHPLSQFHSYNLEEIGVPVDARPFAGEHHGGKHGYTVRSANGAALWLNIGHMDRSDNNIALVVHNVHTAQKHLHTSSKE